ncbi:MAG: histidine phosphatase family protein [Candidatus Alcyoniella australis]|nr:histidine phosphatase family protein [Candidatus Alcyoniella australis]
MRMVKSMIVLVRHGETGYNRDRIVQGRTDTDLSFLGERQARKLGPLLAPIKFHSAFVSPQSRARRTFELLSDGMELEPVFDERLVEVDYGQWEGRRFSELWSEQRDELLKFFSDPAAFQVPGGESLTQLEQRVDEFIEQRLPAAHEERNTLVVAHGGSLRMIVCRMLGLSPSQHFFGLEMGNCSITTLLRIPGRTMLQCLNWRPEPLDKLPF